MPSMNSRWSEENYWNRKRQMVSNRCCTKTDLSFITWLFGDKLPLSIRNIAQVKRMSLKGHFLRNVDLSGQTVRVKSSVAQVHLSTGRTVTTYAHIPIPYLTNIAFFWVRSWETDEGRWSRLLLPLASFALQWLSNRDDLDLVLENT